MFLKKDEFIGASIPQHLFQASQTCSECQQPADLTILITDAWGEYKKISLCKLHWEQTTKQDNANEPEPLKDPAAEPEPSRQKPGRVVPWPSKLKHAAFILTLFLTGVGTATSQAQTGQLSVTTSIESSVAYSQGPDGKWTLIVANVKDSATMFVPKNRDGPNSAVFPPPITISRHQESLSSGCPLILLIYPCPPHPPVPLIHPYPGDHRQP